MSRRDPAFEAVLPAFLPSLNGSGVLISGVADVCLAIKTISVASLGSAGSAAIYADGQQIDTLAVPANGSDSRDLHDYEIPASGDLVIVTTVAMDVSATYSLLDCSTPITKEAARTAAYQASLTSPKAIRTPNIFGGQVEG